MTRLHHKAYRMHITRLVLVVAVLLVVSPGRITHAQESPPDLVVTLRDLEGQGVPQVRVLVRDGSGAQTIAQATTDAAGVATFPVVPLSEIRVVVAGTTAAGVALLQVGADARGVPLFLAFGPASLDLRVEPSGLVLPDPITMIAPDPGAELGVIEAPQSGPFVVATAPALQVEQSTGAIFVDDAAPSGAPDTPTLAGEKPVTLLIAAVLMTLIAVGLVGVALLRAQLRGRR